MANFYIGQRVRIVVAEWHPELIGKQATIVAGARYVFAVGGEAYGIAIDGVDSPAGKGWLACPHHIAPLTPPHEAGQWSVIEALMPSLRDMRELA